MFISDVGEYTLIRVFEKGESYILQSSLSKQETEHEEIFEDTWENKKKTGYLMFKMM